MKRGRTFIIRLTDEEYRTLNRKSEELGVSKSEFVRRIIMSERSSEVMIGEMFSPRD